MKIAATARIPPTTAVYLSIASMLVEFAPMPQHACQCFFQRQAGRTASFASQEPEKHQYQSRARIPTFRHFRQVWRSVHCTKVVARKGFESGPANANMSGEAPVAAADNGSDVAVVTGAGSGAGAGASTALTGGATADSHGGALGFRVAVAETGTGLGERYVSYFR